MDFYELGVWTGWEHGEYPPYWEELRRFVFRLDGYRCQRCGKHLPGAKLNCHHVIPKEKGGSDNPGNLVTLCFSCHDWGHDALILFEETQGGMVTSETVSPEPEPEPEREEVNLVCIGQLAPGVLLHVREDRLPKGVSSVDPEAALSKQIYARWIPERYFPERLTLNAPDCAKTRGGIIPEHLPPSWRSCRYFEHTECNEGRAACLRFGKMVRGEKYNPSFDNRYWHYVWRKGQGRRDWRYKKYGGEIAWASDVCPKCKLWRE